jgi:hypothetical protein
MAAAAISSAGDKKDATSPPKDPSETDEYLRTYSPASNSGDTMVESSGQIEQAIERIINEKFAGRIEHIIYEIIEKAVKKEIDRLKVSLLEDRPHEDHR